MNDDLQLLVYPGKTGVFSDSTSTIQPEILNGNPGFTLPLGTGQKFASDTPLEDSIYTNAPTLGVWTPYGQSAFNGRPEIEIPEINAQNQLVFNCPANGSSTANEGYSGIYTLLNITPGMDYQLEYDVIQGGCQFQGPNGFLWMGDPPGGPPSSWADANTSPNTMFQDGLSLATANNGIWSGGAYIPYQEVHYLAENVGVPGNQFAVFVMQFGDGMWGKDVAGGCGGFGTIFEPIIIDNVRILTGNMTTNTTTTTETFETKPQMCDLYPDEVVPCTFHVDDFTKAGEKRTNYSQSFKLPNTKRNAKIFESIFDLNVNSNFNPHTYTKAVLRQGSNNIFDGYLKLNSVTMKDGEVMYDVNLFSDVTSIKDQLSDITLDDLDFSELDHDYTVTNVTASETGALVLHNPLAAGSFAGSSGATTTDVLRYPLCNWNHNVPNTGIIYNPIELEELYRPWMSIRYLIDRIFDVTAYTYTSNFITSGSDINNLYMDMNWGGGIEGGVGAYSTSFDAQCYQNSGSGCNRFNVPAHATNYTRLPLNIAVPSVGWWDTSTSEFTAQDDGTVVECSYYFRIYYEKANVTGDFRVRHNSSVATQTDPFDTDTWSSGFNNNEYSYHDVQGSFIITLDAGEKLWFEYKSTNDYQVFAPYCNYNDPGPSVCDCPTSVGTCWHPCPGENWAGYTGFHTPDWMPAAPVPLSYYYVPTSYASFQVTGGAGGVGEFMMMNRGSMTLWEILEGVIRKFNLVIEANVNDTNNLIIEPYTDWASTGIMHDWTDRLDETEIKHSPAKLNKSILFHDKLDEDIPNKIYHEGFREIYGQFLFTYPANDNGQDQDVVTTPFAPTLIEAYTGWHANDHFPSIYGYNDDGTTSDIDNEPRLLYNNGVKTLSGGYNILVPAQNGVAAAMKTTYLQFSHYSAYPPATGDMNYNWGSAYTTTGVTQPNLNLVTKYYMSYLLDLYDKSTKIVNLKLKLSQSDIWYFKFQDTILLKSKEYRVNKIDFIPNGLSKVELISIR
jgi:hypothetical protein